MKNALGMDLDQTASLNAHATDRPQAPKVAQKADTPKKPRAAKRKKGDDPLIWIGKTWYVDKHIAGRGRVRRSLGTADKKKARAKAQMVIAEERAKMALGQAGRAKGSPSLEGAVQAWLDTKLHIDATTLVKYSDDVRAFVKAVRPTTIARLTKAHVEQWYRNLYERAEAGGISVDGANNARKAVLEFLRWARSEKGWIGFDVKMPTIFVNGESRRKVHREIVRPETFQRLIDAVAGTDYEVYARIAYYAGLRSGEILRLDWSQVDFDACQIRLEPWQVKGKRRGRDAVFITTEAVEALKPFAKASGRVVPTLPAAPERERYSSKLKFGKALKRLSSLVATKFGDAIRRGAPESTSIHKIRGHLLRHSYITLALEAGAPISLVAKSVGHSNTWITERYAHVKVPSGPLIAA